MGSLQQSVYDYVEKKYKVLPEFPWRRYPGNAVFLHTDNQKWFALVMDLEGKKVGVTDEDYLDVINLKTDNISKRSIR